MSLMYTPITGLGSSLGLRFFVLCAVFCQGCVSNSYDVELRKFGQQLRTLQKSQADLTFRLQGLSNDALLARSKLERLRKFTHATSSRLSSEATSASHLIPERLKTVTLQPPMQGVHPNKANHKNEPDKPLPPIVFRLDESGTIPNTSHDIKAGSSTPYTSKASSSAFNLNDFNEGLRFYQSGQALEAYRHFERFTQNHPNGRSVDKAEYWMGECMQELGRYAQSAHHYRRILEIHPHSTKVPEALYKLGVALEQQGTLVPAGDAFRTLLSTYPKSAVASLAQARIRNLELHKHR
jgi:tol-pal system protein YbgF